MFVAYVSVSLWLPTTKCNKCFPYTRIFALFLVLIFATQTSHVTCSCRTQCVWGQYVNCSTTESNIFYVRKLFILNEKISLFCRSYKLSYSSSPTHTHTLIRLYLIHKLSIFCQQAIHHQLVQRSWSQPHTWTPSSFTRRSFCPSVRCWH